MTVVLQQDKVDHGDVTAEQRGGGNVATGQRRWW